jgi:capsular polysaccharide biosynthesis protein
MVKGLLDRLMARQARLMSELTPATPTPEPGRAPMAPADREARLQAEDAAGAAAFDALSSGELAAAAALIEPFADDALSPRTLTTLSRIRSSQGELDAALTLLRRAEALAPADPKVAYFMAALLEQRGQHQEAIHYRRRLAFSSAKAPAAALVRLMASIVGAAPPRMSPPLGELRLALDRLAQAEDAEPAHRVEAAKLVFPIKALKATARALVAQAQPCPPEQREFDASWQPAPQWATETAAPMQRDLEGGKPARRPTVVDVADAIVHPAFQWVPLCDEGRVVLDGVATGRVHTRDEDAASPLLLDDGRTAVFRLPTDMPLVRHGALLVGGARHYFHDTVEYVGSLYIAEHLDQVGDLPLVVPRDMAPHQAELLRLLGYGEERWLPVDAAQPTRYARLRVPTRPLVGGRWIDPGVAAWLRRRVGGCDTARSSGRRLYVSRRLTSTRRLVNEDEVVESLRALGFEAVTPETLSVREQISLFAEASHIVGPAGAALTNMLYSAPGAQVVVLHNRHLVDQRRDLYYDALAKACGHPVVILACTPARLAQGELLVNADLHTDIPQLLEHLK